MCMKLTLLMAAVALLLAAPLRAEEPAATAHEFRVTGMTCGLCAKAIEKGLRDIDGVRDVQIDRQAERVRVSASHDLSASALEAAIEGSGNYQANLVDADSGESETR